MSMSTSTTTETLAADLASIRDDLVELASDFGHLADQLQGAQLEADHLSRRFMTILRLARPSDRSPVAIQPSDRCDERTGASKGLNTESWGVLPGDPPPQQQQRQRVFRRFSGIPGNRSRFATKPPQDAACGPEATWGHQ